MAEFFRSLLGGGNREKKGVLSTAVELKRGWDMRYLVGDEIAVTSKKELIKGDGTYMKLAYGFNLVVNIGAFSTDTSTLIGSRFGDRFPYLVSARQFSAEHCPSLHAVLDHLLRERRNILSRIYESHSSRPGGSPERRALSAVFDHVKSQIDKLDEQIMKLRRLRGQLHDRFLQVQIMGIVGRVDDTTNDQLMQMVEEEVGRSQAVLEGILGNKIG